MKNQPKWVSNERGKRQVNESEVEYLGFLCVLLQCMRQTEKEAWAEMEVEEKQKKKKKNLHFGNETAHWDADEKQYKQQ